MSTRPGWSTQPARQRIPDNLAIRAIIGEASAAGYPGMLDVACGLRNRGTLEGVYGLRAPHVDREGPQTWILARKAWEKSASCDTVKGAQFWEMSSRRPYWTKGMIITVSRYGHTFYKQVQPAQEWRDENGKRWRKDAQGDLYDENGKRLYRDQEG